MSTSRVRPPLAQPAGKPTGPGGGWIPLACGSLLLASCATVPQAGAPMTGLSLIANGPSIALSWPQDSPLARELRPGVPVELLAEYPTAAGRVTGERLTTGRVEGGSVRLDLPAGVRNPPTGPICLRMRPAGRGPIPIRAAGGASSTDGFRHPVWERLTQQASRRLAAEAERAQLETALGKDHGSATAFAAWRQEKGLANDAAACQRLTAGATDAPPPNVVEPSLQPAAARRECVWRLKRLAEDLDAQFSEATGGKLRFGYSAADISAGTLGHFNEALRRHRAGASQDTAETTRLTRRARQAEAMHAAYTDLDAATRTPFRPLLLSEPLKLTSTTIDELIENRAKLSPTFVAGVLDAFESCLGDSASQFKLSRERWLREQDPRLLTGRTEALRGECRARFAEEARRTERVAQLEARRAQLQAELAALPSAHNEALPFGQSLIRNACTS